MSIQVTEGVPNILTLPGFPDFLDGFVDSPEVIGHLIAPTGESLFSLGLPEQLMAERLTGLRPHIRNLSLLACDLSREGAQFLQETKGVIWQRERITCLTRPDWSLKWVGMDDMGTPEHFRFYRKPDLSEVGFEVEFCYQRGVGAHIARWGVRISGPLGQVSLTDFAGPTPYSPKLSYWRHYELKLCTEALIEGVKRFYDISSHQVEKVVSPLIQSIFDSGIVPPSPLYKVEPVGFKKATRTLRDDRMRIVALKELPYLRVNTKEKPIKKLLLRRMDLPSGGQTTGFTLKTHRKMEGGGSQLHVEGMMSFDRSGPLKDGFLRVSCLTPVVRYGSPVPVAQGLFGQFSREMASAIVGIQ